MEEKPMIETTIFWRRKWFREVDQVAAELEALLNRFHDEPHIDEVWLSHGRTQLQQGLMCVRRAIATPMTF
jgi:hypothetical protein